MQILLQIHSDTRWLVVILGMAAIVKFLIGWLRKGSFKKADRILAAAFSGLMDLQAVLGLVFFLWNGLATEIGFPRQRLEHLGVMLAAVILGHLPALWKKAADVVRFRNTFFAVLGALVFIYLGVAVLPGGWSR